MFIPLLLSMQLAFNSMELSSTHPFLLGLHLSLLAEAPLSLERELGLTMAYAPLGSLLHWGLSFVVLRPGRN